MRVVITGNFINSEEFAPFQRIMNLMKIIENNSKDSIVLDKVSLNKFIPKFRLIIFYPILFFVVFYKSITSLKSTIKQTDVKFVYFYGRNLSMFLPVLILCKFYNKKIMVDHVENPIYLYKFSILISCLRFDQFLGYPFLWWFSDLNIYISKAYQKSIFFNKTNSVFVPIIISKLKTEFKNDNLNLVKDKMKFLIISSLIERDNISKLIEFIEMSNEVNFIEFNIIGRFKNDKILNALSKKININLYNNATEKQKKSLLELTDYFVLFRNFSKAESYSSPTRLAEFISYSKPIIVNDASFVKDVVGDTEDGFYEWSGNENFNIIAKRIINVKPFNLNMYTISMEKSIRKIFEILAR